jgi:hypothetical protein
MRWAARWGPAVLGGDGIRRAVIYWCRSLAWSAVLGLYAQWTVKRWPLPSLPPR